MNNTGILYISEQNTNHKIIKNSINDNISHPILSKKIHSVSNYDNLSTPIKHNISQISKYKSEAKNILQDEEKADYLYSCRNLLKRCPESIETAQSGKPIQIEWQDTVYYLPSKKITLPGGHDIYIAQFRGRTVLSEGEIYHIEDLIEPPQPSLVAQMASLLSHLAGIVGSHIFYTSALSSTASATSTIPTAHTLSSGPASAQRFPRLPFLLSGAAGAEDIPADRADDSARLHSEFESISSHLPHRDNMKVCETNLHLPNLGARKLYTELRTEYFDMTQAKIHSLEWMAGMNSFLNDKLAEIFDQALFLKQRVRCADIIMIKKYIEKNLENCLESQHLLALDERRIKRIFSDQKKVEDYFDSFNNDIRKTLNNINFHTLRKVIEYKNGISYPHAKRNYLQDFQESGQPMNATSAEFYSFIELMEEAQKNYDKNLKNDAAGLIERMLYFNDRELFLSMLDEHPQEMKRILIKRFFYYIFEYSRNNGFSMQGSVFMIPGEFTEFWHNFQKPETARNEAEIIAVLSEQLIDFIQNNNKPALHLDRVIKFIDFVRAHYSHQIRAVHWHEASIWPYNKALGTLDKIIATSSQESNETNELRYGQWSESFLSQIIYNKECSFLLIFLIRLQNSLISIVSHHLSEKITLLASNEEQRIVEAKALATQMSLPMHQNHLSKKELIHKYIEQIANGNIELLLRAAIYWYISHHSSHSYRLDELDALSVMRSFNEAENLNNFDFKNRMKRNFKSIFELRSSDNFTNPIQYYNQFIYYRKYNLPLEARHITYKIIEHTDLHYLELVYPPKEIYTFKIFSRNYVQNSLTSISDISLPTNNFGTISFVKTYDDKWLLISTLLSGPVIREMVLPENDPLFEYIYEESEGTLFQLKWQNRKHISITSQDLMKIFNITYDKNSIFPSPLSLFLVKPEENIISTPLPEYYLVAGAADRPFTSLLEAIDYWNNEALTEAFGEFKETLRVTTWWQKLLTLFPFYDAVWKYWYDDDHTIKIIDIIFDVFDLAIILGQLSVNTGKKVTTLSKLLMETADLASMPNKYLNKQVTQALMNELPGLARRSSINIAREFVNFLNPTPLSGSINKHFQKSFTTTLSADISWMGNIVINGLEKRRTRLINWQFPTDGIIFSAENDGTYSIDKGQETERRLIKFADKFYQVIWDDKISSWRLINQYELVNLNYAVPINKDKNGDWAALSFLDIDQIPLLNNHRLIKKTDPEFDTIKFEPLRVLNFTQVPDRNDVLTYCYFLELLLDRYSKHLEELFERSSDLSTMLVDFVECLMDENQFRKIVSLQPENTNDDPLLAFINDLNTNHDIQVGYRIARMWKTAHDHNPQDHMVIRLDIDNHTYIIDMIYLRLAHILSSEGKQVFTDFEWVHFIKTRITKDFALIKYKDFTQLSKALAFPYREADHVGKYIKDAFLVREPMWYKTTSIKYVRHRLGNQPFFDTHHSPTILAAARHIIGQYHPGQHLYPRDVVNMTLPFDILQEAQIINATQAGDMIKLLPASISTAPAPMSFMSDPVNIVTTESLLTLKPGSLLAFLSENKYLFHLMICVGDGRFAGIGNDFLCPSSSPGPAIIVAEEMGIFLDHKLLTRNSTTAFTVMAGNPSTVPASIPVMLETMSIERTAKISSSGEEVIENISFPQRVKMLTHNAWSLEKSSSNDHDLILKMEAIPANIYPLYSKEMAHMIRALIFANPAFPALSTINNIEIIDCFAAFDGMALRAQTFADELGLSIRTLPYLDTEAIRKRRPDWYTLFMPRRHPPEPASSSDDLFKAQTKTHRLARINAKNERLAKIIDILHDIKRSLNNTRIKRRMAFLPTIFIDLGRLIIRDINFYDFIKSYPLSPDSEKVLNDVLREYTIMISEADEYYIQCFLDIILSVESFTHLANWIFPLPGNNTESVSTTPSTIVMP